MGRITETEERSQQRQGWEIQRSGSIHLFGWIIKNLSLMLSGGMLMLGLLALIGMGRTGSQFFQRLQSLFVVAVPPAKVDVRSVVIQQIRGASELTTAVYSMESVVPASRERTIGGYTIGKTTLLYIARGEVRAGVDLAALQPQNVQVLANTIALQLPPPKILDSKIDVTRSQVYDYDRGFLSLGPDVAPELQEMAQRETLAKLVETACTDGVLQSANERAKLAVSQLLTTAGYSQFTVATQAPDLPACIASQSSTASPTAIPAAIPTVIPAAPAGTPIDSIPGAPTPSVAPVNPDLNPASRAPSDPGAPPPATAPPVGF